jgi:hypothetical protein
MPSMRPHAPNPRAPRAGAEPTAPASPPQPSSAPESEAEAVARAGGFHESSYELQRGLQISESAWPDDVTVPGALGER